MPHTLPLRRLFAALLLVLSWQLSSTADSPQDFTAIGDASYAQSLGLSDTQKKQVLEILTARRKAIGDASPTDRQDVFTSANQKLAAILTPQQKRIFAELVAGGKLRFRFRDEPWEQVLQWFSAQADLALVMNEIPSGNFTYSDAKNHTTSQAIDLLNSVLQGKGYTLVRRDKMLIVSKTADGIPYDTVPKVSVDQLSDRGQFEYVSVIFPLEGRPIDKVSQEVAAFLGPNARATPLPATGQLMVVDTAGRIEAIRKLIQSIPIPKKPKKPQPKKEATKPKKPSPVFQVHTVSGLDVGSTISALEKLFGDAKFSGDSKADQITAFTPPERQAAIAKAIAQMLANVSGDNQAKLEIYAVPNQDLDQLQNLLHQTVADLQISADSEGERLLVVGDTKQQEAVMATLKKLDVVTDPASEERISVYPVGQQQATRISEILRPLIPQAKIVTNDGQILIAGSIDDQQIAKSAIQQIQVADQATAHPILRFQPLPQPWNPEWMESLRTIAPQARLSIVADNQKLAIVSSDREYQAVSDTLARISLELEDKAQQTVFETLDAVTVDPQQLADMLMQQFPQSKITISPNRKQLFITTLEATLPAIQAKYQQLLDTLPAPAKLIWKSYSTQYLPAKEMETLLQPVTHSAQFKADAPRNRMMIRALEDEHRKIEATLAAFHNEDVVDYENVLLVYPLNRGDAKTVIEMLAPMYPEARFSTDRGSKQVLVTAPLLVQNKIQAAIEQLDTDTSDTDETIRSYPIQSISPSALLQLLAGTFPEMRFTPNNASKQLTAIGSAADHQRLAKFVGEVDAAGQARTVEAYDVGNSSPIVVRSVLMQLLPSATISANSKDRMVFVWAGDKEQAIARRAIEQFAKEPNNKKQSKVYRLQHAQPNVVEYILRDLLPTARFADDRQTNTLTATATAAEHDQIASIVAEMDLPHDSLRTTEVYRFDRANARSVENVFERIAPRARVSMVYGTNSVIATASAADHVLFRDAAEKMDGGDMKSVTKVYSFDKNQIDVEDVLESIDDTLRSRVALRMNEQTNSLMVRGSPEDQAVMKGLIDEILAQVPPKRKRTARVYQLQHADPDTVADIMRDVLEEARFREDRQTGTLTATAFEQDHAQIEKVLQQIDIPGQQTQLRTEIYRFDRTDARSAERTFQRLIPRARVSRIEGTNSIVATATDAEHQIFRETSEKLNGGDTQSITMVYPLDRDQIDAEDVLASLDDSLLSRLSVRINEAMNGLIVRGSADDQTTIRELIDQIIAQVPPAKKRVAVAYQFTNGRGDSARYALQDMFEDARFGYDRTNRTMLATASEADQARIATIIQQLDQPKVSNKTTKIYKLDTFPAERMDDIVDEIVSDGEGTFDRRTNTLIVTASPDEQAQVKQAVQDLNDSRSSNRTDRVYSLKTADPDNIQDSLKRLIPQIETASDDASGTVMVSASEQDHERVRQLIDQLESAPGQQSVIRAYVIKNANGNQLFQSLQNTFDGNGDFSLSFQETSNTIFVVANAKNHDTFQSLFQQLDIPIQNNAARSAKTYSLGNTTGTAGQAAISALLEGTTPPATIELDQLANSLIVVGTEQQQAKVSSALGQISGNETNMEVFQLSYADPWSVESAIDLLFGNLPVAAAPAVTSDYQTQRLFIRGSEEQITQIRMLLNKMGERQAAVEGSTKTKGGVRTIPFRGDIHATLKQLKEVWPQIRKNRIQLIVPSAAKPIGTGTLIPTDEEPPQEDNSVQLPRPTITKNIALQDSTRAEIATENTASPGTAAVQPGPEQATAANPNLELPAENGIANRKQTSQTDAANIVIVPADNQLTIASSDHDALDQFEKLLGAISQSTPRGSGSTMGADFAVFLLRNTGASSMRQTLGELFGQIRKNQGIASGLRSSTGLSTPFTLGPSFGSIAVVADDRLNALIIYGDQQQRELVEELLRVLDSDDIPNPLLVYEPELYTLLHTQADRVLAILQNVYRAQLSSGGDRKRVAIPEGVSSEVASVLQQINAAAASPILTLDVDQTTNSIVMRAPPELRTEIKTFLQSLDSNASENQNRNVRVIRIRRGKSDQIQQALEQFILNRGGAR